MTCRNITNTCSFLDFDGLLASTTSGLQIQSLSLDHRAINTMFARKDLERDVLSAYQRYSRNLKKASVGSIDPQHPRTISTEAVATPSSVHSKVRISKPPPSILRSFMGTLCSLCARAPQAKSTAPIHTPRLTRRPKRDGLDREASKAKSKSRIWAIVKTRLLRRQHRIVGRDTGWAD